MATKLKVRQQRPPNRAQGVGKVTQPRKGRAKAPAAIGRQTGPGRGGIPGAVQMPKTFGGSGPAPQQQAAPQPAPAPTPVQPFNGDPFAIQGTDSAETINAVGGAKKAYDDAMASLGAQRSNVSRSMGLKAVDTANGRTFALDLEGNPYSEGARIKQQWEIGRKQTTGSFASQGMLYDGAMQTAQIGNDFDEQAAISDLGSRYLAALNELDLTGVDALNAAVQMISGSRQADADRRALEVQDVPNDPIPGEAPIAVASGPQPGSGQNAAAKARAAAARARARAKAEAAEAEAKAKRKRKGKGKGK